MSTVSKRDYYEVLGVSKTATDVEIKSAYRKLAMKHHPDRNPGDHAAEEKFKEAAEAYAILADPDKRSAYDRFGHAAVSSGAGAGAGFDPSVFQEFGDFADILGNMFGFGDLFSGGRRRGGPQRGADLRYDLEITFEESARGAETTIQIPRQENCEACSGSGSAPGSSPTTCPQCHGQGQVRFQQGFFSIAKTCGHCNGSGRVIATPCTTCGGAGASRRQHRLNVRIPPGVETGSRLRLRGEGEAGAGGASGDLFVVLRVQDHPFFVRDGADVVCDVPVSFAQAALGTEIDVPTLQGTTKLKIPAGTQSGQLFKLRGKGVPDLNGYGRGDEIVRLLVETPRKLSPQQRTLLEEFARISGEEVHPLQKSFLEKVRALLAS